MSARGYVGQFSIRCPCCGDERDMSKAETKKLERKWRVHANADETLAALIAWADLCDNTNAGIPGYVIQAINKATGKRRKYYYEHGIPRY